MTLRARITQIAIIAVTGIITLALLELWLPGLTVQSVSSAIAVTFVLLAAQLYCLLRGWRDSVQGLQTSAPKVAVI